MREESDSAVSQVCLKVHSNEICFENVSTEALICGAPLKSNFFFYPEQQRIFGGFSCPDACRVAHRTSSICQ